MSPKQLNQNQTVSVRSSFEKKYPTSEHHVNGIDLRRLNIYPPAEVALNILRDDRSVGPVYSATLSTILPI